MKVICNIHPFILMFCVEWNVELYYPNGFVDVFHIFIGNLVNDNTKMDLIIYYTYILCSYVLTRIMYLIIYLIFFNDFFSKMVNGFVMYLDYIAWQNIKVIHIYEIMNNNI